ncbi:MAG: YkgJ family cysteine cluster protein [Gammaproteobacteria bacterium]|nr:YkgJ family cysteine cluster protein [Gammaproteobacteria bacterium]
MKCRPNCGACCIAPSISTPIPGMPNGKPAGVLCVQLDADMKCKIFAHPDRPDVCQNLLPSEDMCCDSKEQALRHLGWLDEQTS